MAKNKLKDALRFVRNRKYLAIGGSIFTHFIVGPIWVGILLYAYENVSSGIFWLSYVVMSFLVFCGVCFNISIKAQMEIENTSLNNSLKWCDRHRDHTAECDLCVEELKELCEY